MADLVVIVPSRGRPEAAHELCQVFGDTCSTTTHVVFAIDDRDSGQIYDYPFGQVWGGLVEATTWRNPSTNMVEALNCAARSVLDGEMPGVEEPFAICFMGDDHRPRTKGWDARYLEALRELGTGIVYGNDLLQGENLPTQVAMTSDIVQAIGHMAPPVLTHLYVDNYWKELGDRAGCLRYLPDVVVEHMHPVAGKAEWDEGHRRVNEPGMYQADQRAFREYAASGRLSADVHAVRALRAGGWR